MQNNHTARLGHLAFDIFLSFSLCEFEYFFLDLCKTTQLEKKILHEQQEQISGTLMKACSITLNSMFLRRRKLKGPFLI